MFTIAENKIALIKTYKIPIKYKSWRKNDGSLFAMRTLGFLRRVK